MERTDGKDVMQNTLPEGFVLDTPQAEGLPEGFVLDNQPKTPFALSGTKQQLPKLDEVESKIGQRTDSVKRLIEELKTPFDMEHPIKKGLLKAAVVTPLKMAAVPFQRAESGIASAGLAAQRGDLAGMGRDFLAGISGKRPAELGDLVRTTGFGGIANEPLAATTGLLGSTGLTNLATKGRLVEKINQKMPKVMNDSWLKAQAKKTFDVADEPVKQLRNEYDGFYKSIGDTPVDGNKLQEAINKVVGGAKEETETIVNEIKKQLGEDASFNINNAKKIKDIISGYIPESTWIRGKKGISLTPRQEKLSQAYFELDDIIKGSLKGSEEGKYYEYLNAKATDIYRLSKAIKNMVVDETGQPAKTSQLVSTFTGGARTAGKRDLFKRLNEINDKTNDVIKAMDKFKRRTSLKKFAGRAAPWIPAALGLGYMGNRMFDRD